MIGDAPFPTRQTYDRGLAGLVAGDTAVGTIDGRAGRLVYRGYDVGELAERSTFEEVTYLILFGDLPEPQQLADWRSELRSWRTPPQAAMDALHRLPSAAHPLAQYRAILSVAACHIPEPENTALDAQWRRPARILAWTSALASAAIRHLDGLEPVGARDDLDYAANFLWQTLGREAAPDAVRAFDASLVVQAEHGLHAACFAALTVISTGADLGSAVLAGMGALSGVRHGGANQLAYEMLEPLADADCARRWVRDAIARGHRFPGYGHRVYKCPDPRVTALEPHARRLLESTGMIDKWRVYSAVREEIERTLGAKGIFANVDSITGLVYAPIGLPAAAFPIPFCLAIQTGWMAHCLEYLPSGTVIEPGAIYTGGTVELG